MALLAVEGVGALRARNLIRFCGSPAAVFDTPPARLALVPEVSPKLALAIHAPGLRAKAEQEWAYCQQRGIRILSYLTADFPPLLRVEPGLPLLIYVEGALPLHAVNGVGVVGTRRPSDYGRRQAQRFASFFAQNNLNVVSGLAYGIDAEAHLAVLEAGGVTTAVLGHGLGSLYPAAHRPLARRIVESGGALVSEYPSWVEPSHSQFPERNRIIAALCRATVVVEAAETGGALITARQAFEMNREVFAIPGALDSPTSAGCHALIQQNIAQLVATPEEVLTEIEPLFEQPILALRPPRSILQEAPPETATLFATPAEVTVPTPASEGASPPQVQSVALQPTFPPALQAVMGELSPQGVHLDVLSTQLGVPPAKLLALLLELEMQGLVQPLPGGRYALVSP